MGGTLPKNKLPANIPTDIGECRGVDQYVLVPGCYVPCSEEELLKKVEAKEINLFEMAAILEGPNRGHYTVENNLLPSQIIFDELQPVFKDKIRKDKEVEEKQKELPKYKPVQGNGKRSVLFDLKINDVTPARAKGNRFPHPLHDSATGQNWSTDGELGHCWRHMVSLNALQFLVVKSGYISCVDAGTGHKQGGGASRVVGDDGAIFHAWLEAKKLGVIPEDDAVPVNALHYIARKHKVCPEHLIPKRGEFSKKKLPRFAYNKVLKIIESEY